MPLVHFRDRERDGNGIIIINIKKIFASIFRSGSIFAVIVIFFSSSRKSSGEE